MDYTKRRSKLTLRESDMPMDEHKLCRDAKHANVYINPFICVISVYQSTATPNPACTDLEDNDDSELSDFPLESDEEDGGYIHATFKKEGKGTGSNEDEDGDDAYLHPI